MTDSRQPSSLLLLQHALHTTESPSHAAVQAAYGPALAAALAQCRDAQRTAILVVAVVVATAEPEQKVSWAVAQALLSGLYTTVAVESAKLDVAVDDAGPGSVDARVVFVTRETSKTTKTKTILVDLAALAATTSWKHIFYVDTDVGKQLRDQVLSTVVSSFPKDQLVAIPDPTKSGSSSSSSSTPTSNPVSASTAYPLHHIVCLGGTFDHLHPGHKLLLTAAALLLDASSPSSTFPPTFIIGVTGDELLRNKKYAEFVQSWDQRARSVVDFLATVLVRPQNTQLSSFETGNSLVAVFGDNALVIECVCIHDPFGPTITRREMDCLVVSAETHSGGAAVNEKRVALGWQPLVVYEVDVLSSSSEEDSASPEANNFASKISSTAIRQQRAEATGKAS